MSTKGSPLEELKGGFRRACVRRLVGDEKGAIEVLKNEIPILVVAWAKVSSLDPGEKKAKLKELFDDESSRADELAAAFDLFAGRFETRVASRVNDSVRKMVERFEKISTQLENTLEKMICAQSSVPHSENFSELIEEVEDESVDEIEVEEEVVESPIIEDEEVLTELDPPSGTGLKFDEIEQMIDELLSAEK